MDKPRPMRTRITDLLGCNYPIIQAGMGGPGRSELCTAVTMAGGFGCIGMVQERPELIRREISIIKQQTDRRFGVNLVPAVTDPVLLDEELSICFEEQVGVMVFFWDVRPEVIQRAHDAGCIVIYQVGRLADALAAERAGADAVICQGVEAGGHVHGSVTSLVLLPQVAAALKIPVIGAGGFGSGASLVAALALGAEGVHCGTAFLATEESFAMTITSVGSSRRHRRTLSIQRYSPSDGRRSRLSGPSRTALLKNSPKTCTVTGRMSLRRKLSRAMGKMSFTATAHGRRFDIRPAI